VILQQAALGRCAVAQYPLVVAQQLLASFLFDYLRLPDVFFNVLVAFLRVTALLTSAFVARDSFDRAEYDFSSERAHHLRLSPVPFIYRMSSRSRYSA
jgi:hypothetical protein